MSEQKLTGAAAVAKWLRLRKNTVWAHWLYGLFCALAAWQFFPAGIIFLLIFARWERWNDTNEKIRAELNHLPPYKPEGDLDFWDSLVVKVPSFATILALNAAGILTIRWY
jgi:hypothetical protein